MATKAARSRSFLVIGDIMTNFDPVAARGLVDWEVVECKRKAAVGCGPTGMRLLEGISLYVLRGDDDDSECYPQMGIRVTTKALQLLGSEIDDDIAKICGRHLRVSCRVYAVEGDIMIISLPFIAKHDTRPFRAYYLVYNSATGTLFLIPCLPPHCPTIGTRYPLLVRREDGIYSLVLLANRFNSLGHHERDVLCLLSLPPLPDNISRQKPPALPKPQNDMDPWVVKDRRCTQSDCLIVYRVLSCKDTAFWVDLRQGILYCSFTDLLKGPEPVDFKYVQLPMECRIRPEDTEMMDDVLMRRNMGLVGNSIWFVAIEPSENCASHTKVAVWTLDLTKLVSKNRKAKQKKWQKLKEFKMQSIWELDAFRKEGLPMTQPRFPILRQQDDGVLYMMLPNLDGRGGHLVGIHVGCSTCEVHLRSCRSLAFPWMSRPVVLPPDFFTTRDTVV